MTTEPDGTLYGARLRGSTLLALARERGPDLVHLLRKSGYSFVIATDEDAPVRGDGLDVKATSVLAAALPALAGIGVLPSVDLTLAEPFNVAREAATLDILSDGRAGLALLPPIDGLDAANYGVPYRDLDDPAELMRESIEVLRLLWDSWAPDAVARDWATNRFVNADRVRRIDYAGRRLQVAGPSATPRSPQGVLPIVADLSGLSSPGEALRGWAAGADVVAIDAAVIHAAAAACVLPETVSEDVLREVPEAAALREVVEGLRGPGAPRVLISVAPGAPENQEWAAERAGLNVAGVLVDATDLDDREAVDHLVRSGRPMLTCVLYANPEDQARDEAREEARAAAATSPLRGLLGLAPAASAWDLESGVVS